MTSRQRRLRTAGIRNKSRGNRSPLDALPASVQTELFRRLDKGETYREVQQWLAESHSLNCTITPLSDWYRKRKAEGPAKKNSETVRAGGFEITVTAPCAELVTVRVRPFTGTEGLEA